MGYGEMGITKKLGVTFTIMVMVVLLFATSAGATSGFGVSANPTKSVYSYSSDSAVVVAVQNHNTYWSGANLIPQQLVSGKWVSLGYDSPNPLKPGEKKYDTWNLSNFEKKTGTFRFKVEVDRYDSNGDWVSYTGAFYTTQFTISK